MKPVFIDNNQLRYAYHTLTVPLECESTIFICESKDENRLYFDLYTHNFFYSKTKRSKRCSLVYGMNNMAFVDSKVIFSIKFSDGMDYYTFAKEFAEQLASEKAKNELKFIKSKLVVDIPELVIWSYLNDIDGDKVIYNEEDANERLKLYDIIDSITSYDQAVDEMEEIK